MMSKLQLVASLGAPDGGQHLEVNGRRVPFCVGMVPVQDEATIAKM